MKFLVTGAGGILGREFLERADLRDVAGVGRAALDIARPQDIMNLPEKIGADVVIHCAADTNVEEAERNIEGAFAANAVLPGLLATGCRRRNALFVYLSSTGCYGDWKSEPYVDDDELRPTTIHHRSKAAGEQAVRDQAGDWLIVRTGWLYGGARADTKAFVFRRLEDARKNSVLLANPCQIGNPTYTGDLVTQIFRMIDVGLTGVFNAVARGSASRLDYVRAIVEAANLPCRVEPAPSGHFQRRAPVSFNEAAVNRKLSSIGLDVMPNWRTALTDYVAALMKD